MSSQKAIFECNDLLSRKLVIILSEDKDRDVTKLRWKVITKTFNNQNGLSAEPKQLKNHHGKLKNKHKAWEELCSLTGISFDPLTGKVDGAEKNLERYNSWFMTFAV